VRAAELLAKLGAAGTIDVARVIVWLLRSRDANIRRLAVDVAARVGDAAGDLTPKLLRFLRDEDWWVRERVMGALVELSGSALTRHLAAYLQDPSDVVRRFAIGGLARVRDPRALGALVKAALEDDDWWVREQAIATTGELGDKKAIPYVMEALRRHPSERLVCIEALRRLEALEAVPLLVELCADEDTDVRLAALECLAAVRAPETAEMASACAGDAEFRVRRAAQEILARLQIAAQSRAVGDDTASALDRLLSAAARMGADDLILLPGNPPSVKHMNKVVPLDSHPLTPDQTRAILFAQLTPSQVASLAKMNDVDFSHEVKADGLRFRGHVFSERRGFGAVFRSIKNEVPDIEKLDLPPVVKKFGSFKNGLVLIGGPTGSGKSTTLAALVGHIHQTSGRHIVTVEDPIEVIHGQGKSLINQREVGTHTTSFAAALRSTLRQDPDVILMGEMRDLATIHFAVSAAETGHLVFGTVHTVSAETSVDRLVNAFPSGQQPQVRTMLSDTLRAVACQHLLRTASGKGRVLAVEVMINNDAIASLIRKGKTFQIATVVQTSKDLGMQSMDSELIRLASSGVVSVEEAYMKAKDKKAFEAAVGPVAASAAGAAAGAAAGGAR
jgi:twitching motility protein PilT